MKPMSDQLNIAAFASALALAALCLHAPAIQARGEPASLGAMVSATAEAHLPSLSLTALLPG